MSALHGRVDAAPMPGAGRRGGGSRAGRMGMTGLA